MSTWILKENTRNKEVSDGVVQVDAAIELLEAHQARLRAPRSEWQETVRRALCVACMNLREARQQIEMEYTYELVEQPNQ